MSLRSLTVRLMTLFTLTTLFILVAIAWHLDHRLTGALERDQVEFLEDTVDVLRTVLRERPGDLDWLRLEVEGETSARSNQPTYLRVMDADGVTLAETEGMATRLPALIFRELRPEEGPVVWSSEEGRSYLLEVAYLKVHEGVTWKLNAALDTEHTHALLEEHRLTLFTVVGLGVLLALLGGMIITRTGLAPLREIGAVAQRITAARLDERIGGHPWPSELAEIASSFDAMLERLEEAFQRIYEFSDDLAHELRTPLTNLRGETEVALASERSPEQLREVLLSNLEELQRLSTMIEDMLFLARSEHPGRSLFKERVELDDSLTAVVELYEPLAEEAELELVLEAEGEVCVNPDLLRRAVSNLLSNAIQHTPSKGLVHLHASVRADGVGEIRVADSGPGIPVGDETRIFERFYRAERSRVASKGGSGLGLSIVRRIMDLHGGSVHCVSCPGSGAELVLTFPAEEVEEEAGCSPSRERRA